jgi:hypothetical protein
LKHSIDWPGIGKAHRLDARLAQDDRSQSQEGRIIIEMKYSLLNVHLSHLNSIRNHAMQPTHKDGTCLSIVGPPSCILQLFSFSPFVQASIGIQFGAFVVRHSSLLEIAAKACNEL